MGLEGASAKIGLAVDLGASSGRVLAGTLDSDRFVLEEVHRFPNGGVGVGERLHWDVLRLWADIKEGLTQAGRRFGDRVASVAVDTWGVDFGLLDRNGELLANPHHYRDSQNAGMLDVAFHSVPRDDIFAATGLQFMEINSLYQLLALRGRKQGALDAASHFVMMADLFHLFLTGEISNEVTNSTTSQCFDPRKGDWARSILERFGLPVEIFGPVSQPGTRLGSLRASVQRETRLGAVEVVLPGTHDTASAVAAIPGLDERSAYISSGTWSLMGVEIAQPIINDDVRRLNFTNEGGVANTIRLLKNIGGLWLLQEARRQWARSGQEYSWAALLAEAERGTPFRSIIDPDASDFLAPSQMIDAIAAYCRRTGQPAPEKVGEVVRCTLESLALRYRWTLGALEELVGHKLETIRIVGGGSQNRLLCQLTADACQRPVVTGPVEATALGNVMVQAMATGHLGSLAEARAAVAASISQEHFTPGPVTGWDEAFG
ncbi:MAG: rhamnulokinase, partial [Planctomycetales bacterium]|nr:rhamnulokinase [Planctomycetales bacterium]